MAANRLQHILQQLQTSNTSLKHSTSNNSYKYTVDAYADKVFTKEQRDFYEINGYIIVRNLLPIHDVNICNNRFDELISNASLRLNETLLMRDITLINKNKNKSLSKNRTNISEITKLQDFAYDPVFWKHYFKHPNILKYVKAFTGKDVRSWTQMLINKPTDPGTLSSRHPLHQDLFYWPITNENRVCACWVALQHVNRSNGGLCIIPGSHTNEPGGKLLPHDYPNWNAKQNAYYYGIPDDIYHCVARYRKHINMNTGDAVFFHPLIIHGSSANLSKKFRRSLCCHFLNSAVCKYKALDMKIFGKAMVSELKKREKKAKQKKNKSKPKKQVPNMNLYWKLRTRQIVGNCGEWGFTDKELKKWAKIFYKRNLTERQIQMNTIKKT